MADIPPKISFAEKRAVLTKRKQIQKKLEDKYELTGQDLNANLEGLLHGNYLKYWDYIQLETLLSLQRPRTDFPDEKIFITYHQITELYFKLILWEIEQLTNILPPNPAIFLDKIKRINRYLLQLTQSFDIMIEGMDVKQFRQFRMALLPASGFQSAQFRKIEICCTDFVHLLNRDYQSPLTAMADISEVFEFVYWKQGAIEIDAKTGEEKETLTSLQFQEKYKNEFIQLAHNLHDTNILRLYELMANDSPAKNPHKENIKDALRELDLLMNVNWRLAHYKSAVKHLIERGNIAQATGGTNWQGYLPPRFQKIVFFPNLWTVQEKEEWGKKWVEDLM